MELCPLSLPLTSQLKDYDYRHLSHAMCCSMVKARNIMRYSHIIMYFLFLDVVCIQLPISKNGQSLTTMEVADIDSTTMTNSTSDAN